LDGRREQDRGVVPSPTNRAFVVKLSVDADPAHVVGRVEHVASGASARFEVLDQLGAFMARILGDEQAEADPQQQDVE
jgi:hypothetical protein